ncbi:hypothetical protein DQ04_06401040, partial [Trypanosoma grayi]|uniref:hypothetical protein n=1 Tax=Trypanosoma grayi TaxID=71804 RepID=UPI0004F48854
MSVDHAGCVVMNADGPAAAARFEGGSGIANNSSSTSSSNGDDDGSVAAVFRRHRFPFDAPAVERLFCVTAQLLMPLEEEVKESAAHLGAAAASTPASSGNNGKNSAGDDTEDASMLLQALLQRRREMQRRLAEQRRLQAMVAQLREEKEALEQRGLAGLVRAAQQVFHTQVCASASTQPTATRVGDRMDAHVSGSGADLQHQQRTGGPAAARPMSAQSRREAEYLLHVLQAAHHEAQRWQDRCAVLQAELGTTESQRQQQQQRLVELGAELDALRLALEEEQRDKLALQHELHYICRLEDTAAQHHQVHRQEEEEQQQQQQQEQEHEDEQGEEEEVVVAAVCLIPDGAESHGNADKDVPSAARRVPMSPSPKVPAFSPVAFAAFSPRESDLERLAREDAVAAPLLPEAARRGS